MTAALALSDAELEAHIADLGRLMLAAHERGDLAEARAWLAMQALAIRQRSPEQVARMEIERFGEPCYFCVSGDAAREAALQRGAL